MPQFLKACISTIFIVLFAVLMNGCKPERAPKPSGNKVQRVNEDTFVKPNGWDIPSRLKAGETGESHQTTADGDLIPITFTNFYPIDEIVSAEPLESVGYKLGDLQVLAIIKCDSKGKTFEYSVQTIRVNDDNKAGKFEQFGTGFFYRYYDMDGDGLFETLITDSSDVPVPDWAQ